MRERTIAAGFSYVRFVLFVIDYYCSQGFFSFGRFGEDSAAYESIYRLIAVSRLIGDYYKVSAASSYCDVYIDGYFYGYLYSVDRFQRLRTSR